MQTVFVTGAGGYIGSVLVPKLLKEGYKVIALDRFFFGLDKLPEHPNLKTIQDDTRRYDPAYLNNVDFVIDLVAVSNDPSGELFSDATMQINYESRVRTAMYAKAAGAKRYILPSSCSIYGFQDGLVDETATTNPLTTYAKANEKAEQDILPLAEDSFIVTVMRQATVFGLSPRMRFDLAINGMTYGAWKNHKLPLMRDGKQYRPMVHVQDTTDVMIKLLTADADNINGQIFNVGGAPQNYQLGPLGETVAAEVGRLLDKDIPIEWYGDPDHRSYQVAFDKIENAIDWRARYDAAYGVREITEALQSGKLEKAMQTITLDWYKHLEEQSPDAKDLVMYGGMLNINLD